MKQEDRILRDEAWELCTLFDVNFQPRKMSVSQLEAGLRSLARRVYEGEVTNARRAAFHRNYRRELRQRIASSRQRKISSTIAH